MSATMPTIVRDFSPVAGGYIAPKPGEPRDLRDCHVQTPPWTFFVQGDHDHGYAFFAVKVAHVRRLEPTR